MYWSPVFESVVVDLYVPVTARPEADEELPPLVFVPTKTAL
jgi:hypothetical protein